MTQEIRHMSLDEFRSLGLLQEINRRFLHPLGLALEMVEDPATGKTVAFGGVQDCRDDLEGFMYGSCLSLEKADKVRALESMRREARETALGYWIQPCGEDVG